MAGIHLQSLDRVDGTQHLGETAALGVESEAHVLALSLEAMTAEGESVAIDLIAVAQPRLNDPVAAVDLQQETMHIRDEILIDLAEVMGDDRAEEQTTEPGGGIDRQDQVA